MHCCRLASINFLIQDSNGDCASLTIHNQINKDLKFQELKQLFPIGTKIGIKNPYYLRSYEGIYTLRNDNPSNIILKKPHLNLERPLSTNIN